MAGKGSTPRPIPDREQYSRNWDAIEWGTIDDRFREAVDSPEVGDYNLYDPNTHDANGRPCRVRLDAKEREYGIK